MTSPLKIKDRQPAPPGDGGRKSTHQADAHQESEAEHADIFAEFNQLDDSALITEVGLAMLLNKHPVSLRRALERGELPASTKLMGKPIWSVQAIRDHINKRLAQSAAEQDELARTIRDHS